MKATVIALAAALGIALAAPAPGLADIAPSEIKNGQQSGPLKNGPLKGYRLKRSRPADRAPESRGGTLSEDNPIIFF